MGRPTSGVCFCNVNFRLQTLTVLTTTATMLLSLPRTVPIMRQQKLLFSPVCQLRPLAANFSLSSTQKAKVPRMTQVEVDEAAVQQKLGKINMDFVRKAEKRNKERATLHRFFRRKDWIIAGTCFGIVICSYTIWAIQQEKFLDDFEMPEEIDRTKKDNVI